MGKTLTQLGPDDAGVRLTREAFAGATFVEGHRYERVRGRLVVMSPIGWGHRSVSRPFIRELCGYWRDRPDIVEGVDPEGWVATGPDDDRVPDIAVYLKQSEPDGPVIPERVPELVIEFVSESRSSQERDYIFKREEYHRIGVKEYVIVDRFKQQALVLHWQSDEYTERVLTPADTWNTTLLPGFAGVALAEVFGSAD